MCLKDRKKMVYAFGQYLEITRAQQKMEHKTQTIRDANPAGRRANCQKHSADRFAYLGKLRMS